MIGNLARRSEQTKNEAVQQNVQSDPAHFGTLGLARIIWIAHCAFHGALLSSGVVFQANPERDL